MKETGRSESERKKENECSESERKIDLARAPVLRIDVARASLFRKVR
jgi:hypothetical protein